MTADLLSISDLSLQAARRALLQGVSLTVRCGEKIALVGANGAGKSSLLKTIAGLNRSYAGSVKIEGREVRRIAAKDLAELVSLVPQRLEFVPRFTVREFFELNGLFETTGFDSALPLLLDRYLPDLSGGELQRVILAGAVAQGAKLLLLDEPTAHLDPTGRNEVERVIGEYHRQQTISYLLVTHDIALALRNAERIVVMKDGAIMWDGGVNEPSLTEVLQRAYGCSFTRIVHPNSGMSLIIPG